jgi:hypothetical protein
MIFGIADDLAIKGFTASTRELDTFLLYIDNIVRNGAVLKEDNEVIKPEQITTRIIKLDNIHNILIISIVSEETAKYQLKEGVVYYRLNASNYRVTNNRYYTESQVTMMIRDKGHMIHKEYSGLIAGMDKEIKRTCDEIAKRDKALAETHLYMSKANRDLAHVNQMLTEHILAEKIRVEHQLSQRWCFFC